MSNQPITLRDALPPIGTPPDRSEKLRHLRRVVDAAPDERFHMAAFCERARCGTVYCAAGWAAIDPWFRANTAIGDTFRVTSEGYLQQRSDYPFMGGPFTDLANLFEIDLDDCQYLFGANPPEDLDPHAVTKAEVIANINRLLGGNAAEEYAAYQEDDDDENDDWDVEEEPLDDDDEPLEDDD